MAIRVQVTLLTVAFFHLVPITVHPADLASASPAPLAEALLTRHDLFVELDPDTHALVAQDRITLQVPEGHGAVRLSLAPSLIVDRMTLASADRQIDESAQDLPFEAEHGPDSQPAQHITIPAAFVTAGTMTMTVHYHGLINDPPREPRHLRFVTPSETAGHIGPEGVYLSSETQWYLDLPGSLSTYRLRVALPEGWTPVTQGRPQSVVPCPPELCRQPGRFVTEWDLPHQAEALTLVANRFVVTTRDWRAKTGQPVQLATYLFPENAHLADEYLEATARYLDAYVPLLGPYPFDTFAVVENFFASGLGMPSFTLLGSGIIKRHYVQAYALGHEIVHSWIGNAVFNRIERGNWVEGLTTYLANYYWHELSGDQTQALDQRRLLVRGYNLHVPPDRDYPVGRFTHKRDERDNAIGYQKSAMVFHLLRQEVRDEVFWTALKRLVERYRGRHAEWRDLERTFAESCACDLRWFFKQWVEEDGAPSLSLAGATARPLAAPDSGSYRLDLAVLQTGKVFLVPVQLRVLTADGNEQVLSVRATGNRTDVSVTLPARPTRVLLDPNAMLMRRIARRALPPVLNHYVTDRRRSVIQAFTDPPGASHPFRDVVARLEAQDAQKPRAERVTVGSLAEGVLLPEQGSVLVLADPNFRPAVEATIRPHCGERLRLQENGVTVNEAAHEGAGTAALVSCHRADRPDSVVTLLYAVTPSAATTVARLLFFYGWNSFILFHDGVAVSRGEWAENGDQVEVSLHASEIVH